MAYVAITDRLIYEVSMGVRSKKEIELRALPAYNTVVDYKEGAPEFINRQLWGGLFDIREELIAKEPKIVYRDNTAIRIKVTYTRALLDDQPRQRAFDLTTTMPAPAYVAGDYRTPWVAAKEGQCATIDERIENHAMHAECEKRWTAVEEQLVSFLRKCKSLNEAVKLWPDVRKFIPKDRLDKLDEKVERVKSEGQSQAAEAAGNLNVELINGSFTAARIADAQLAKMKE